VRRSASHAPDDSLHRPSDNSRSGLARARWRSRRRCRPGKPGRAVHVELRSVFGPNV